MDNDQVTALTLHDLSTAINILLIILLSRIVCHYGTAYLV